MTLIQALALAHRSYRVQAQQALSSVKSLMTNRRSPSTANLQSRIKLLNSASFIYQAPFQQATLTADPLSQYY